MELDAELLAVLNKLGATEAEIDSLITYYTAQLAAAEQAVTTISDNISSLQVQLTEETGRRDRLREGIAKFLAKPVT